MIICLWMYNHITVLIMTWRYLQTNRKRPRMSLRIRTALVLLTTYWAPFLKWFQIRRIRSKSLRPFPCIQLARFPFIVKPRFRHSRKPLRLVSRLNTNKPSIIFSFHHHKPSKMVHSLPRIITARIPFLGSIRIRHTCPKPLWHIDHIDKTRIPLNHRVLSNTMPSYQRFTTLQIKLNMHLAPCR